MILKKEVTFFLSQQQFRAWLKHNHHTADELLVGFYKVGSGKLNMTWSQSVDEALCFGWIDGVRNSIDAESYCIRFTKRKPNSIWSAVNIKKVAELTAKGLMMPAGIASFEKLKAHKAKIYTYENEALMLSPAFEKQLIANKKAWQYFDALAASYKKLSINWVMSAKQETPK